MVMMAKIIYGGANDAINSVWPCYLRAGVVGKSEIIIEVWRGLGIFGGKKDRHDRSSNRSRT